MGNLDGNMTRFRVSSSQVTVWRKRVGQLGTVVLIMAAICT